MVLPKGGEPQTLGAPCLRGRPASRWIRRTPSERRKAFVIGLDHPDLRSGGAKTFYGLVQRNDTQRRNRSMECKNYDLIEARSEVRIVARIESTIYMRLPSQKGRRPAKESSRRDNGIHHVDATGAIKGSPLTGDGVHSHNQHTLCRPSLGRELCRNCFPPTFYVLTCHFSRQRPHAS